MTAPYKGQMPTGMHTLMPHIVCRNAAEAIDFYKRAFDAEEVMRLPGPDGAIMHAAILINGSGVLLVDENPQWGARSPLDLGGSPVTIHLTVEDAHAAFDKAVAGGAEVVMPVAEQFWGDIYGVVRDPYGHTWSFATPLPGAPRTEAELAEAMRQASPM